MRIAVTGKQGQVVSSLAELAPDLGVEVIPIGRPELDLLSPETVQPALINVRPDIVVNAAAYTAVDQAEKEPEVAMAVNARGSSAVADAAWTLSVPLIHLSTDYVFDGSKATPYVEEARNLLDRPRDEQLRGIFHMTCTRETNWAEFALAIFESLRLLGRRVPKIRPITTAEYPTPARRPSNSRLDCTKLARLFKSPF